MHAEKLEIKDLVLTAKLGQISRDEAYEKIVIRIRSEFHQRFLDALNEARRKYKKQSKLEIKIEEDIMDWDIEHPWETGPEHVGPQLC